MNNIYSIYKITNQINNKMYIGYTGDFVEKRFKAHKALSKSKPTQKISLAMNKHGIENFTVETLYQSYDYAHTFQVMEPHFIDEYDTYTGTGYNSTFGGIGILREIKSTIHNGIDISNEALDHRIAINNLQREINLFRTELLLRMS